MKITVISVYGVFEIERDPLLVRSKSRLLIRKLVPEGDMRAVSGQYCVTVDAAAIGEIIDKVLT